MNSISMQALVDEPCLIHKTCERIVGSKDMSRCQSLVLAQAPRVQLVYRYHSFNLYGFSSVDLIVENFRLELLFRDRVLHHQD